MAAILERVSIWLLVAPRFDDPLFSTDGTLVQVLFRGGTEAEPGGSSPLLCGAVGEELVRTHGKQRYYKPPQVRRAAEARSYPVDLHCWAYCIFTTPEDFKAIHDAAGEACDYAAMKAEVLAELASGGTFSWLDIDLSWLEWPDIDLSSLFDWFDLTP